MKTQYEEKPDGTTVIVTRQFDAPLQKVWKAWTDPKELDKWWAPKPWKAETKSLNFTVGCEWLYAMKGPEGEVHWSKVLYTDIKNNEYFTGTDNFCDADGNPSKEFNETEWKVGFEGSGNQTLVTATLRFASVADKQKQFDMGFKEGFAMGHDNLDQVLQQS